MYSCKGPPKPPTTRCNIRLLGVGVGISYNVTVTLVYVIGAIIVYRHLATVLTAVELNPGIALASEAGK